MKARRDRPPGSARTGSGAIGRRAVVAGFLAAPLFAPALLRAAEAEALAAILERSRLGRQTGFAVADLGRGEIIEAHQPDIDRPPASVVKILTALYALDVLGPGHRFRTALVARGAAEDGRVPELALVGGGDPVLDTDGLGDLAVRLAEAGVRGAGRFAVAHGALPSLAETEAGQPGHVGYNPAISGVNLNFNRVHLAWGPGGDGRPALELTAPGQRHSAKVRTIRAELAAGAGMRHGIEGGAEVWRLAPALAKGKGSVWLPVRRPPAYAGDVFASLAERRGVAVPEAEAVAAAAGRELAARQSPPLEALMQGMLKHSTNLTAEVAGLAATRGAGVAAAGLGQSAAAMGDWARARYGLRRSQFVNHSGLTVRSQTTARETVAVLMQAERAGLAAMLEERPILDARGDVARGLGVKLRAKTGTMHFLRGLAGYVDGRDRRLAFAIFAADVEARDGMRPDDLGAPPGARDWLGRARGQENALLRRWAALYA